MDFSGVGKKFQNLYNFFADNILTLFPPLTINVGGSLICSCTLVAYIADTMDPDQTAPEGAV